MQIELSNVCEYNEYVFTKGKQVPSTVYTNKDKINNISIYISRLRIKRKDTTRSLPSSSQNSRLMTIPPAIMTKLGHDTVSMKYGRPRNILSYAMKDYLCEERYTTYTTRPPM